jgi:hypothetical protein
MKSFIFPFVLLMILLFPKVAFGSCSVTPSVEDEAKEADLIFAGTVTKLTPAQLASAGYPLNRKKVKWEKHFFKTDIALFTVTELFKGDLGETAEIATSADGEAGYKFEGGTWLKVGQTYLVYSRKRQLAGTVDDDLTEENYGAVAAELKKIQESFPKTLAAEINEFNSKVSPFSAGVCGRTKHVSGATEELRQLRVIFPNAKRLSVEGDTRKIGAPEAETGTFLSWFLSLFGFA